ncbi:MAG TPA: TonB-dependent receptor, partial [Caulobacteraceae bacterium]
MQRSNIRRARLMCGAAAVALALPFSTAASAAEFNIAPQSLTSALKEFGIQSQVTIVAQPDMVATKRTNGLSRSADPEVALAALLEGTGLSYRREADTYLIVKADGPQSGSAAGGGAEVEALIVTAQKREEDIQDVPIAISAFTQEALERSQVAGGPDLMTQVPNMTFTKTNFTSYSIQLRGIGTQAISATTDPSVAVAFNNTPFIANHFFEQEFYDLQRVEVLRGPQGTLYGRNATAGVVNVISAKPTFRFEAKASGDLSNYSSSRIEGMVNIPLVEDTVALRLAGAWTKRDGYATNQLTGNPIDGRDLWSTRASLRFSPNDRFDANLIWEHFEEDDDRLRSGKQLCKTDNVVGEKTIGGILLGNNLVEEGGQGGGSDDGLTDFAGPSARFSLGCEPSSLYSPDSFQTVQGLALPYYAPLGAIFLPTALHDPYVSRTQSHDLRVIESAVDPHYSAKADTLEFQFNLDLTDTLTLTSETGWMSDFLFSTQDYNRFNTAPGAWDPVQDYIAHGVLKINEAGNAEFCDPQIGCSDRLVATDLATSTSRQFAQEFRLASDFDGPFNFSLGANFTRYDTEVKYYVFINSLTLYGAGRAWSNPPAGYQWQPGVTDNSDCMRRGPIPPDYNLIGQVTGCQYIDPNPINNLNDLGHNYFLSKNPYKLISYAVFGEAYYNITDALKITAGLRWTVDKKDAPRIPSWVLSANNLGYPIAEVVEQEWREPTGRLTVDWKPDLAFTDETLLYASYAHGYKAGGANPPAMGSVVYGATVEERHKLQAHSATKPRTFEPEFVDAFEVGSKNTLLDGRATLNLAAFYYDYKDYQISYITDRSAVNLNFDATVWGLEIEADWRPLENLRLGFKGGYENTRVADGEKAVDIMDRANGGKPDANGVSWVVVKPFPTFSNNCILPEYVFATTQGIRSPGGISGGHNGPCELAYLVGVDPVTRLEYVPNPTVAEFQGYLNIRPGYPGFNPFDPISNFGEGLYKDLSGNELPNAPNFTATITADYTVPLPNDWLATLHTDLYYQSEAWTRIFNMEGYDKLKAYTNVNLAAIFTNEDAGWKVMAYVKNVFDRDSITGAFLNSDDSGLTTNVFLTEPRLYGIRVTKEWTGGSVLGAFGSRNEGAYPFTIELGGMVQRHDAPNEVFRPSFADAFSDEVEPFSDQENDLDWGDQRSIKLTYAMPSGWKASLAGQRGETNGGGRVIKLSKEGVTGCTFAYCPPGAPSEYFSTYFDSSNAETRDREEHTVVDFSVGRDVGLGIFEASTVSAGLRYAQFKSTTSVDMYGIPDWSVVQSYYGKYYAPHHRYGATFETNREFKGLGPVLSWDASRRLLGNEDAGRLDLDMSVSAGVLFGKQKTSASGSETSAYYYFSLYGASTPTPVCPITHASCPPTTTVLDIK